MILALLKIMTTKKEKSLVGILYSQLQEIAYQNLKRNSLSDIGYIAVYGLLSSRYTMTRVVMRWGLYQQHYTLNRNCMYSYY